MSQTFYRRATYLNRLDLDNQLRKFYCDTDGILRQNERRVEASGTVGRLGSIAYCSPSTPNTITGFASEEDWRQELQGRGMPHGLIVSRLNDSVLTEANSSLWTS